MSRPTSLSTSSFSPTAMSAAWTEKKTARQRPGLACEGCRRRKLRCDGQQPQCGACFDADVDCITTTVASTRGPRKGHVKALQARLFKLEQQLQEQQQQQQQQQQTGTLPVVPPVNVELDPSLSDLFLDLPALPEPSASINLSPDDARINSYMMESPISFVFLDLQRADLDQVYFERAHPFVPIIHQRHYFSWSRQGTKSESQTCLQYAMWTLAASLSAQMQHIRVSLYESTRRMLETLEADDSHCTKSNFNDLEHVQARVLFFIYEFLQTNPQRGFVSSGRCFRLLQLMRLSEIDTPENIAKRNNETNPERWIRTEEKRRTFWIAYSLDRFISLLNEWPLMLNEHTICTRLPAAEEDFRAGQGVEMPFLSEAMIDVDQTRLSSFTEVIILATICGRAITHQQQSKVDNVYKNTPQNFWDRHQWLDEMLKARAEILAAVHPSASQDADCMLLFANMILHTTVLCLGKAMESVSGNADQNQDTISAFNQRCFVAAKEIVSLSGSLADISYFKVHPFTPLSLILCVEFFNSHRHLDESLDSRIQEIYSVLGEMSSVNNLAQNYFLS